MFIQLFLHIGYFDMLTTYVYSFQQYHQITVGPIRIVTRLNEIEHEISNILHTVDILSQAKRIALQ